MELNQYLIFSGCLSAVVFTIVLSLANTNQFANRFLALLILSIGLNLFLSWSLSVGFYNQYPFLHLLPYGVGFGLGPIIYLYVWTLTSDQKPNYRHLIWFLADYPHSIYHWVYGRSFPDHLVHEIVDKLGFISLLIVALYLWKSRKLILTYQKDLRQQLSNVERLTLNWLNQLTILFLFSIPLAFVLWIILITTGLNFNDKLIGHMFYVIVIFWLGIGGIRQPEIVSKTTTNNVEESRDPNIQNHLKMLTICMSEDYYYLLPDLNVRYLEDRLGLTAKQISEALNKGLGKNFYTFINEYRVEEFKKKVKGHPNLTFAGLARECGFNSKTTFQRVFKEITGMRPSEYVNKL